jgi:hypothetical protein
MTRRHLAELLAGLFLHLRISVMYGLPLMWVTHLLIGGAL